MERPATWKVITVGAAFAGLGLATAGAAPAVTAAGLPAQNPAISVQWTPALDRVALASAAEDTSWEQCWDDTSCDTSW